jgi:hypothetical protein
MVPTGNGQAATVPVALGIAGIQAARLLHRDAWVVALEGRSPARAHTLRAWQWGERRRLVAACARGRRLDQAAFVHGLNSLLYEPAPPPALAPLFALVALRLLGTEDGPEPSPLGQAEAQLAQRFGWLPGSLQAQPAAALDALLHSAGPARADDAPAPGWQRIVLDEEEPA